MKNLESYIGKFVKVTDGKHDGSLAYVETIHDWKGGSLGIVSGNESGRFECLVKPNDIKILTNETEIALARKCACSFYEQNIKSLCEYCDNEIIAGSTLKDVQHILDIIVFRCNTYKALNK